MTRSQRHSFLLSTEDGRVKEVFAAYDYCDAIKQLNDHMNACYFQWEIVKHWRMK